MYSLCSTGNHQQTWKAMYKKWEEAVEMASQPRPYYTAFHLINKFAPKTIGIIYNAKTTNGLYCFYNYTLEIYLCLCTLKCANFIWSSDCPPFSSTMEQNLHRRKTRPFPPPFRKNGIADRKGLASKTSHTHSEGASVDNNTAT